MLANDEIDEEDGDMGTGNNGGGGIGACCGEGLRMNFRSNGKWATFQYSLPMLFGKVTSKGEGDIPPEIILKSVATLIGGSGIKVGSLGGGLDVTESRGTGGEAFTVFTLVSRNSWPSSFVKSSSDDENRANLYG